jgi:hypothetical protein
VASPRDPFIFAAFDGDGSSEQELWIYTSLDGLAWASLVDTNFRGPSGTLRDPSIIRHTDGRYYVAYTVQSWSTQSTHFNIASSTDLAAWTAPLTGVASLASKRHGTVLRQGDATNYRIVNRHSGKVVDVQNVNTSNGALVGQWAWNGNPWQQWQFVDLGDGYHVLISRNSSKCLDVSGASTGDGAVVIQWTCAADPNQQWQMVPAGGGDFNLRARHSGKCLNVVGSSVSDAALLEQRACGSAASFRWSRQ